MTADVDWSSVWAGTAAQLDRYRGAGLEQLMTEDVLRFATIQQLVAHGISPADLVPEWRRPGVSDAVDLVIAGTTPTAFEFKYPREPRETNAAWTQHLGEALKDFYRLAHMPADFGNLWCVQFLSSRMRRYLDNVADRHGVRVGLAAGETTVLEPDVVRGLPATALKSLVRWTDDLPRVTAYCVVVEPVGADLLLVVHRVNAGA